MYGGADTTAKSPIADDATAPTHRRRNPGQSLHGGPTLQERVISPIAVDHQRHRNYIGKPRPRSASRSCGLVTRFRQTLGLLSRKRHRSVAQLNEPVASE
jgi:hypothetical protein